MFNLIQALMNFKICSTQAVKYSALDRKNDKLLKENIQKNQKIAELTQERDYYKELAYGKSEMVG